MGNFVGSASICTETRRLGSFVRCTLRGWCIRCGLYFPQSAKSLRLYFTHYDPSWLFSIRCLGGANTEFNFAGTEERAEILFELQDRYLLLHWQVHRM